MGDPRAAVPRVAMVSPEPFLPPTSGGQLRMSQHLAVLRRLGCAVDVAALVDDTHTVVQQVTDPEIHLYRVRRASPAMRLSELARAVIMRRHPRTFTLRTALLTGLESARERQPDLVLLEYTLLAAFLPDVRRRFPGVPVIVDVHNAETQLLRGIAEASDTVGARLGNRMRQWWMRRIEATMVPTADEVWVASADDAAVLPAMGAARVHVVPNAIDTDAYAPAPGDDAAVLVFSGTMDYFPNVDAARWMCQEILPRISRQMPGVRLFLVGKNPGPIADLAGPVVSVTGFVPDPKPYLAQAAAVVVPMRVGSGTRLKILEALAMGKAVVTTRKGCEGLDVTDGVHLLLADDAEQFARQVVRALRDPSLRRRLGEAGRHLVVERYSWHALERIIRATLVGSLLPSH